MNLPGVSNIFEGEGIPVFTYNQIRKALDRIDRQRRSGCYLHVSAETHERARRAVAGIIAADEAHDRRHRINYGEAVELGGAA